MRRLSSWGFLWASTDGREYNRTVQGAADLEAAEKLEAAALLQAFTTDEAAANARFNEKVVEVSGKVKSSSAPENGKVSVTLETGDPLARGRLRVR